MQFELTALAALFSAAVLTTAKPLPDAAAEALPYQPLVIKPIYQNRGLYFCTDADWRGQCIHTYVYPGECAPVVGAWLNKISSFGPDRGVGCILYSGDKCTGDYIAAAYPGFSNLKAQAFNDKIRSVKCG